LHIIKNLISFVVRLGTTILSPYSPFENWEWWVIDIALGFYILYKVDKIKNEKA